jgi:hypothetical protein
MGPLRGGARSAGRRGGGTAWPAAAADPGEGRPAALPDAARRRYCAAAHPGAPNRSACAAHCTLHIVHECRCMTLVEGRTTPPPAQRTITYDRGVPIGSTTPA